MRKITIELADDATAKRCGSCPHMTSLGMCVVFKDALNGLPKNRVRLNACIAAEKAGSGAAEASKPISDLVTAYERARARAFAESIKAEASGGVCSCTRRLGDYCPTVDSECPMHGTGKAGG